MRRKNEHCDSFGHLLRYDARRPTWPHSGKNSRAVQEGFPNTKKLPKLDDYCPCGEAKMDVEVPYYSENEEGQKVIKNRTVARPDTYRNCCAGKNRETA